MLAELFYWVMNMSILASLAGAAVLLLRKIRGLPRRFTQFLWLLPLLRMWIPVGMSSRYSLMTLISALFTKIKTVYLPVQGDIGEHVGMTNSMQWAESYFPLIIKEPLLEDILFYSSILWAAVGLSLLGIYGFLYCSSQRAVLAGAEQDFSGGYFSQKVSSPAVYGILKPKIVLPVSYRERELSLILLHEQTHIKRKDNLWRVIGFVTACVHWFNPLSWLFLRCFLQDLELACDETLLKRLSPEEQKDYARTLLDAVQVRSAFASCFGGAGIGLRIRNILSYKRLSAFSCLCLALLLFAAGWVLLTNAL